MIDFPSVRLSGALEIARARVLWDSGMLKVFDKSGIVTSITATQPTPKPGWRRTWWSETFRGSIKLSARCPTCGGWRRVTRPSAEELWIT